ncbi:hypothetical protein PIB30_020042 [Stylosanthes scabra]|uniref:chitinase n=1 Tax=Stylosanthes scabra TaxID=79078 RepID=A0ABU6T978_9FABA|nr:hypothetical protein [Stylosanthes scabra]
MDSMMFALLFFFLLTLSSAHAKGEIAVYWGQSIDEGTLTATCDTGNYQIVILAFLITFGCGQTPAWNFDGHCGSESSCHKLQPEIQHCQLKGVKVFLSLGGHLGRYFLCSPDDADKVADYLYTNFLSGQGGPLGSVKLDGIDFDIEIGSNLYWDDLARQLNARRQNERYFYLSAAPRCSFPDYYLDMAISTWLFDYIFVKFYYPTCQFNSETGDPTLLTHAWNQWTSHVKPNNKVFMGLVDAGHDGALPYGYIPPAELCSRILPIINQTRNYGGVMLDRFEDARSGYSHEIKDCVEVGEVVMASQM